MSLPKTIFQGKDSSLIEVLYTRAEIDFPSPQEIVILDPVVQEEKTVPLWPIHPRPMLPSRVAIIGNYLPRRCGIATFTTDLCDAIHAEYGATELLALPVNDTPEGYSYPPRIRFELSQDELASYRQAADFLNFSNIDLVCLQHEYGIFGGRCHAACTAVHRMGGTRLSIRYFYFPRAFSPAPVSSPRRWRRKQRSPPLLVPDVQQQQIHRGYHDDRSPSGNR